jgi:hypothetical protein
MNVGWTPKLNITKQVHYSKLNKTCSKFQPSLFKDTWWHNYIAQTKWLGTKEATRASWISLLCKSITKVHKKMMTHMLAKATQLQNQWPCLNFLMNTSCCPSTQHNGGVSFPCFATKTNPKNMSFYDLGQFWTIKSKCWIRDTWRQLKLKRIFTWKKTHRGIPSRPCIDPMRTMWLFWHVYALGSNQSQWSYFSKSQEVDV